MKESDRKFEDDLKLLRDFENAPPSLILEFVNSIVRLPRNAPPIPKGLTFYPIKRKRNKKLKRKGPFYAIHKSGGVWGKEAHWTRARFLGWMISLGWEKNFKRFVKKTYGRGREIPSRYDLDKIHDLWEDIRERLFSITQKRNVIMRDGDAYRKFGIEIKEEVTEIWHSPFKNLKMCPTCGRFWDDETEERGRPRKFCSEICARFVRIRTDEVERYRFPKQKEVIIILLKGADFIEDENEIPRHAETLLKGSGYRKTKDWLMEILQKKSAQIYNQKNPQE
jgi:endogenous inhibitor of DNA gyrase (YacG/DUF329 family)